MAAKHSSESANRVIGRLDVPSDARGIAEKHSARAPWPVLAAVTSRPTAMTAADCKKPGFWSSVITYLMEGFALSAASMYPTMLLPVELHPDEEKIPQPRESALRKWRGLSLVSTTESRGAASRELEHEVNQTTPARYAVVLADDGSPEFDSVTSFYVDRSNRWNWLTPSREAVVTLWAHARRERQIKKAAAALAEFDDQTLRDLGIPHRAHIEQIVRYCHDC